jgi:hypothetical protein
MQWRRLCIALAILAATHVTNRTLVKTELLVFKKEGARLVEAQEPSFLH